MVIRNEIRESDVINSRREAKFRELLYLFICSFLLFSCQKIYHPSINNTDDQLVVEARITNDPSISYVHISRTRGFYSTNPVFQVSGAKVELFELGKKSGESGIETTSGFYAFKTVPVSGKEYFLRITIQDDVYESTAVRMPPLPELNNFHSIDTVAKFYKNNENGVPQLFSEKVRMVCVDLPVTGSLSYYRLDVKTVWECLWDRIPNQYKPDPDGYVWYVYYQNQKFNLAAPAVFAQTSAIKRHPLINVSYNIYDYMYADTLFHKSDTLYSRGFILKIDQYGTSKESYAYHKNLNDQFESTGSLFDRVQTQVNGNILCKNNPSTIVYGFFDLNSYREYRYYFYSVIPAGDIQRQIFRYPILPSNAGMIPPPPIPTFIPKVSAPEWWE